MDEYQNEISKIPLLTDNETQESIYKNKDGDEIIIEEAIADDGLPVEEIIVYKIRNEDLQKILLRLTKEERELLLLRYGIIDGINHTLDDIAQQRGISIEAVRQKEVKALKKLRHPKITKQIKDFFEE